MLQQLHHYGPLYLSLSSLWAPLPIPFITMGPFTYPFHLYGPLYLSLSSLRAPLPIPFISTGPFTYPFLM